MIADTAAGRMPAFVDTGPERGPCPMTWRSATCWRWSWAAPASATSWAARTWPWGSCSAWSPRPPGRKPPRVKLPIPVLYPLALASEALARIAGIEPIVTRDILAMAKKKMFFSSDKARRELGYAPRPARDAVFDAVAWFRQQGRIPA